MGREIRRVPVDFDCPLGTTWHGYLMPDELQALNCPDCGGNGLSPRGAALQDRWYGHTPFRPEDNESTPFTPDTPAVRARAERNVANAPEFYGPGEWAIRKEAARLTALFNGSWSHHLNADDVQALIDGEHLRDLTHRRTEHGWEPIDPPVVPSPAQVNEWSLTGFGHDSTNAYIVASARCEREGVPYECGTCEGSGQAWRDDQHKADHEAWEATDPPSGDGWQLWQTVSEGGPISPVFATADGLIEWMTTPAAKWGASGPWPREAAAAFVNGPGWAPTFMGGAGGVVDGVTAMAQAVSS